MDRSQQSAVPPHAQLIQMGSAYWVSRIVHAAAVLGLADALADGPRRAEEIGPDLDMPARPVHRLLRALANIGVVSEETAGRFGLTPLGEALKTGAPGMARSTILTLNSRWYSGSFDHLLHAMRTGETGALQAVGMPVFDYLAQHPDEASLFSQTMVGFHGDEPDAVAAAFDFSRFRRVVDVGGATGNLLASILRASPTTRGTLFDLPHVVADAPAAGEGVTDRLDVVAGDMFASVPKGGDAYVLSHVLHDWSEARCLEILARCREAMGPRSSLLIVEMVLPDGDEPHPGKMLDIAMLVLVQGEERTEAGYASLLGKAGFELVGTVPTRSAVSIIEARPLPAV